MSQEKIYFITDSACDIPAKDEQELSNLCILPIPVTVDGKGYFERESFTPEQFYDMVESCREIPSTSHIPSVTFQEKYEQAVKEGYTHIIAVTIYSGGFFDVSLCADGKRSVFGGTSERCPNRSD